MNKYDWCTDSDMSVSGVEWAYVLGETGADLYDTRPAVIKVRRVRYDKNVESFDKIHVAAFASAA